MPDDVELEHETELSRTEIADLLETFAGNLRGLEEIELELADRTVVVDPPETIGFEVEIEDEPEGDGVERSIEFELEWLRGDDEDPLPEPSELEE